MLYGTMHGIHDKAAWDEPIKEFLHHRHSLSIVGPDILLDNQPVIPPPLRKCVMDHRHTHHQGANAIFERPYTSLYWPNFHIDKTAACSTCSNYQPCNPDVPYSS